MDRYQLEVSWHNNIIYTRCFRSINQVVKFLCGFSNDCYFICTDLVTDRIFSQKTLREYMKELMIV